MRTSMGETLALPGVVPRPVDLHIYGLRRGKALAVDVTGARISRQVSVWRFWPY